MRSGTPFLFSANAEQRPLKRLCGSIAAALNQSEPATAPGAAGRRGPVSRAAARFCGSWAGLGDDTRQASLWRARARGADKIVVSCDHKNRKPVHIRVIAQTGDSPAAWAGAGWDLASVAHRAKPRMIHLRFPHPGGVMQADLESGGASLAVFDGPRRRPWLRSRIQWQASVGVDAGYLAKLIRHMAADRGSVSVSDALSLAAFN